MAGQLILGLSILVGLHEFGHFAFAKLFKIRVDKFYIFFDFLFPMPNVANFALIKKKVGETEYGIGWFPLGGYVRMLDEREGEVPALVWLTAAPGHEEACIAGLQAVLGPEVPVVGGSAADDEVAGGWYQLTRERSFGDAVVVSALFPTGRVVSAFQSGYTPTGTRGVVTRARGRTLIEIDGAPAATVYDAWTGGAIAGTIGVGGSVLASTTLFPLGRRVGAVGGVPYYRLAHPATVHPDGSMDLFAEVNEGEELVLMHGDVEALVTRAGRVAVDARALDRRAHRGGAEIGRGSIGQAALHRAHRGAGGRKDDDRVGGH